MERLPLLTPDSERRVFKRQLRVGVSEDDFGAACLISRRVLTEGLFTSLAEHFPEVKVSRGHRADRRITADNPFLAPGQRERLDARGVIREGVMVHTGDVLVSILESRADPAQAAFAGMLNERAAGNTLGQLFAEMGIGPTEHDDSFLAPLECSGAIVRKVLIRTGDELGRSAPKGLEAVVTLELLARRELEIGDLLAIDEEQFVVAGVLEQPPLDAAGVPADLVLSAAVGRKLQLTPGAHYEQPISKANARAAEALEVRSTGPYALITMQPLRLSSRPGQKLSLPQVQWLQERELTGILDELTGLKSDNLVARAELRRAIERGNLNEFEGSQSGAPEMLAVVALMLRSLGLNVELQSSASCGSLALAPATSQELLAVSSGLIPKPETLNYRTYDPEPGGLFCPKVFGASLVTRRRRFGHVLLPMPVVSPIWRMGKPSLLEQWLRLSSEQIEGILACQVNVAFRGDEVCLTERNAPQDATAPQAADQPIETGSAAIRTLLARVPPERLPAALRGRTEALTPDIVLVLPPDLRPIVLLDSGNFATSDLNDLLRRLINRRNRMVKLAELKAPQVILDNEQRMLQDCVDALHANSIMPKRDAVTGSEGRPQKCTLGMVAGFLQDDEVKRVEWAGRARVVTDANIPSTQVLVPRSMFQELQLGESRPVHLTTPEGAAWAACLPQAHESNVIALSPATAAALDLLRDQPAECILHRPLGVAARAEAQQLLEHGPPPLGQLHPCVSWATASSPQQLASQLAAAASSGDSVSFDTPQLLLVGGSGGVDLSLTDDCAPDARRQR